MKKRILSAIAIAASAIAFNVQAQDVCTGLVTKYYFNNSATNHKGTESFSNPSGYTEGMMNQAIYHAYSGLPRTATISGLPTGYAERTITMWVYRRANTNLVNSPTIFSYGTAGVLGRGFGTYFNTSGALVFNGNGSAYEFTVPNSATPANTWHHIAITYALNGTLKYYLDGQLLMTEQSLWLNTGSSDFSLGNFNLAAYFDDLRIFNRVLSDADIAYLYNNPEGAPTDVVSDLSHVYTFNSSAEDHLGNAPFSPAAYGTGRAGDGLLCANAASTATLTLPTGNSARTVAMWLRYHGTNTSYESMPNIFSYGNNAENEMFGSYFTGELLFQAHTNDILIGNNYTPPADTWFHIAVTYDGNDVNYYVNGELKGSAAMTLNTGNSEFTLGAPGGHFTFDDLKIYSRALSSCDIQILYSNPDEIPFCTVNIPDNNFKTALLNHTPVIDINDDGKISCDEAADFTGTINVANKTIGSIQGIEAFTQLTGLNCNNNHLTRLDISQNTALTTLSCGSNRITALDLSNHTALTQLLVGNNSGLSSLNIANGNNTNMTLILANYNWDLTCIQVDDAAYSNANWTSGGDFAFDSQVGFSENCSSSVGIEETEGQYSKAVTVYPNPAISFVTVENIPEYSIITVFDLTGKTVYQTTTQAVSAHIRTDDFESGVYYIQIESNDMKVNKKLVISK